GLASLLSSEPGLEIVGEAEDGGSGIRLAAELKPDVIIMDLIMPGMDGVETTRQIMTELGDMNILILTTFGTADGIAYALESGARGAILKNASLDELVSAVRAVAEGKTSVSPEIEQILSETPPVPKLSPRQSEVLESVARGLSNEDISKQLGISVARVRDHLSALFAKMGTANRAETVATALRKHLLKI
ncbi:MAG: response regulator transcription factor, partial [Kiritimatiellae bacterium]|nr:response regulator transcription factor [Kiritimatiellia bacterium]